MDKCNICNTISVGNSPTGAWCNNCGWQDPCPCCQRRHKDCMDYMNKIRTKNNLSLVDNCCCGKLKEEK